MQGPFQYNIGIDFGTAFTKCVIRDIRASGPATVVNFGTTAAPSFLFPSVLKFDKESDAITWPDEESSTNAIEIPFLKMALYASLRGRRNDRWIDPLARVWPEDDSDELENKIESLVTIYLGGVIERCLRSIRERLPGFGALEDIWTVNMAVPVAHAQDQAVEQAFHHCLGLAWRFAQEKHNSPRSLEEIARSIGGWKREGINFDFCFIYPEVSANVQSFLRSPARRRGTFLFVDVGAGTVDASTFIWPAPDHEHRLSYLGADVIPLGSSQIELRCTASVATRLTRELCLCKEHKPCTKELKIDLQAELEVTGEELAIEVTSELRRILNLTRQKLSRSEWNGIRVLLAGGGSANAFYTKAVEAAFQLWHMEPASLQLPTPAADVDWPVTGATARDVLFRRISVAYGLSFDRGELDGHRFPDEIAPWRAEVVKTEAVIAPDKDVC